MTQERSTALYLFDEGFENNEIADLFGINEEDAERVVSEQRSAERGLPSPYEYLAWKRIA